MPGNVMMKSSTESESTYMLHQSVNSTIPDTSVKLVREVSKLPVYASEHIGAIVLRFSSARIEAFHKSSEAF
jgi:hypothetical protein